MLNLTLTILRRSLSSPPSAEVERECPFLRQQHCKSSLKWDPLMPPSMHAKQEAPTVKEQKIAVKTFCRLKRKTTHTPRPKKALPVCQHFFPCTSWMLEILHLRQESAHRKAQTVFVPVFDSRVGLEWTFVLVRGSPQSGVIGYPCTRRVNRRDQTFHQKAFESFSNSM